MTKHTSGPWEVKEALSNFRIYAGSEQICETYLRGEDDKANARLIAAAPKMLEALKSTLPILQEYIKEVGPCEHDVNICICGLIKVADEVSEAISKAEGGE